MSKYDAVVCVAWVANCAFWFWVGAFVTRRTPTSDGEVGNGQ